MCPPTRSVWTPEQLASEAARAPTSTRTLGGRHWAFRPRRLGGISHATPPSEANQPGDHLKCQEPACRAVCPEQAVNFHLIRVVVLLPDLGEVDRQRVRRLTKVVFDQDAGAESESERPRP